MRSISLQHLAEIVVCTCLTCGCVPAEDLDQAIERAVEAAVGAKYAKKVRKRFSKGSVEVVPQAHGCHLICGVSNQI